MNFRRQKAMRKDFLVELKNTINKFISLLLIVALGVAFYTGIRSTEPDMIKSVDKIYDKSDFMDLVVINYDGFTKEAIDELDENKVVDRAVGTKYVDLINQNNESVSAIRLTSYSDKINVPSIDKGRNIENPFECIVNKQYLDKMGYKLGDEIELSSGDDVPIEYLLKNNKYKIVGTFTSPFYINNDYGNCNIDSGKLGGVAYICEEEFLQDIYNVCYVTVKGAKKQECYSDLYNSLINSAVSEIDNNQYKILDRNLASLTYAEYEMDASRIGKIGKIVPMIFFIVAALVSLTTMTRMVEEHRTQIGTLKALGYDKYSIARKYILYGLYAVLGGSAIGGIVGVKVIPYVIINAYRIMYSNLTIIETAVNYYYYIGAILFAFVCVVGATICVCMKVLNENAAELMRPVAPKSGKKVILEHMPFVWNRMSFIWKSTTRNLLRYKKRMFMTIFGIFGCMSLLLLGFGIKNSISSIVEKQYIQLHKYNEVLNYESSLGKEDKEKVYEEVLDKECVEKAINVSVNSKEFMYKNKKLSGYLYVPESNLDDYICLREDGNKHKIRLSDEGVVITKKMSKLLGIKKGDSIVISNDTGEDYYVTVEKICENYIYHYAYMSPKLYEKIYGIKAENNQILIKTSKAYKDKDVSRELLAIDGIGSTNSIDILKDKFSDMLSGLNIIIVVVIVAAGGLAFTVLYNLNTVNISERIRELATLKVLGFYDLEVSEYVFRENIVLTIIGILLGYFGGNILHEYVIDTVEVDLVIFGREIFMASYVYATLITIVFSLIINLIMHYKLKKIDMATSLKSVE